MNKIFVSLVFFLLITSSTNASNLNIFSLGLFDFNKQKNEAIDLRFERRIDKKLFDLGPEEETLYTIKPFYGLEFTTDSAFYILGGVYVEEELWKNFFITPNFGVGYYSNGDGKDLGSELEFRSTLEVSYGFSRNRIGLSLGHISNASIGEKNPGTEILSLSYQIPF